MRRCRPVLVVVAAAALSLSACESGPAELSEQDQATIDAADIAFVGTDDLSFDPDVATVASGQVEVALTCERSVNHNLAIDDEEVVACRPGTTTSATVELEPGTHPFVCTVPGHERRMRGELTVE